MIGAGFTVNVRRKDFNIRKLLNSNTELKKSKITVGVHPEDNARDDGENNAFIAAIFDFGRPNYEASSGYYWQPPRPLLTVPVRDSAILATRKAFKDIDFSHDKPSRIVDNIGRAIHSAVMKNFDVTPYYWAPNAPSTIEKKGHGMVGTDSGQLKRAIKYKIRRGQ